MVGFGLVQRQSLQGRVSIGYARVDDFLSLESVNPVQNKVITKKINDIEEEDTNIKKDISQIKEYIQNGLGTSEEEIRKELEDFKEELRNELGDFEEEVEDVKQTSGATKAQAETLVAILKKATFTQALTDEERNALETAWTVTNSGGGTEGGGEPDDGTTGDEGDMGEDIGNITGRTDIIVGQEQNVSAVSWLKGFNYGTQTAKYSTDVEVVDKTVKLKSAKTKTFYTLSSSDRNDYDVLLGKFVEGKYGNMFYIDPTATYTHLKEEGDLGERIVYSLGYPIKAVGSEVTYTWKKYEVQNNTEVVREKLNTTARPSDAMIGEDNLWSYSYAITDDGTFALSEEKYALSGYAHIKGGDGTSIYQADWKFVYQGSSYTDYYKLTITNNTTKGAELGEVTSNNADEYPSNGIKDGYWYVLA